MGAGGITRLKTVFDLCQWNVLCLLDVSFEITRNNAVVEWGKRKNRIRSRSSRMRKGDTFRATSFPKVGKHKHVSCGKPFFPSIRAVRLGLNAFPFSFSYSAWFQRCFMFYVVLRFSSLRSASCAAISDDGVSGKQVNLIYLLPGGRWRFEGGLWVVGWWNRSAPTPA